MNTRIALLLLAIASPLLAREPVRPNGEKKNLELLPSGQHGPVRVVAIQRGGIST